LPALFKKQAMKHTNWFDRLFPPVLDNGVLPCILERLEVTAPPCNWKLADFDDHGTGHSETGCWSIKKEIGHLFDLEPLWYARALQIIEGRPRLLEADLSNRKTHEAPHDQVETALLISLFAAERTKLMDVFRQATELELEKSSLHPRLETPMRLIDLAFFIAEHDDHHLAKITSLLQQA